MSSSDEVPFILEQVEGCLRLARQCHDDEIAGLLITLARKFARRAIERGIDASLIPELARPAPAC